MCIIGAPWECKIGAQGSWECKIGALGMNNGSPGYLIQVAAAKAVDREFVNIVLAR